MSSMSSPSAMSITTPSRSPAPEVVALDPRAVRARRRPLMVFAVFAWELSFAFLIAAPVHSWAKRTWGAHPDGDAVFFRSGGHELISWLGDGDVALPIVVRTTLLLVVISMIVGQVVLGTLIASMTTTRGPTGSPPRPTSSLRAGLGAFFPLVLLGIVFGAVQLVWLTIGFVAGSALDHALLERLGDARSFTVRLVVLGIFALLALVTGVICDLGRVAIAREVALATEPVSTRVRLLEGMADALRTARRSGGRAIVAWAWRAAIGVALIVFGGFLGTKAGGSGGAVLILLFVMHQLIVFARTALRASWLANAVRLVEAARD
jgi:hypothetical protein